jgi:hypothetical protein
MWLLIASALGSSHDDRVAGVDAAVGLHATGDLDGPALGQAIGQLVAGRDIKLTRVTPALADLTNAIGYPTAWHTVAPVLATVLPNQKPPAGTPDLLALAATVASPGLDTPVAGLAETAARTGNSRLVTEARRLHRILTN